MIFKKAGQTELSLACSKYDTPLKENGLHSISFPLISAGIFGGSLTNPAAETTKQCCGAYKKFISDFPEYTIEVRLCAFSEKEMQEAKKVFDGMI